MQFLEGPRSGGEPVAAPVPIGVLLVDDQRMFVESLARAFGSDDRFQVLGVARTCAGSAELAAELRPDIAVIDYFLPDGTGAGLAESIRRCNPGSQVVILTRACAGDDRAFAASVAAGCAGFVTKDRSFDELVDAVLRVHGGSAALPSELLSRALPRLRNGPGTSATELTDRELEILGCLALGLSTAAIARHLIVSVNTIRNHVHRILTKLGAHSKLEAVAIATQSGLLHR